MWDFAQTNEVNFTFMRKVFYPMGVVPTEIRYVYSGYMDRDTYLAFKLSVPAKEYE